MSTHNIRKLILMVEQPQNLFINRVEECKKEFPECQ